jgi:hypothetical protein
MKWLYEFANNALRNALDILWLLNRVADDCKLIAAEASHDVMTTNGALDVGSRMLKERVAGVVPYRVVDLLELVQIDQQQREFAAVLLAVLHRSPKLSVEVRSVGEACQFIPFGLPNCKLSGAHELARPLFDTLFEIKREGPELLIGQIELAGFLLEKLLRSQPCIAFSLDPAHEPPNDLCIGIPRTEAFHHARLMENRTKASSPSS